MKTLFLLTVLSVTLSKYATGQIVCILCYDQNDSISSGVNNLLLNGSFENNNCIPNTNSSTYCPNADYYSCDIANWTCTGGGAFTYASIWNNALTFIPDGLVAPYFGNDFCYACSATPGDVSCLSDTDCTVTGIPDGYPHHSVLYGGSTGVSLEQTVSGLITGNTYVLEFWSGGEDQGVFLNDGVFAVDVGFGDTLLRCKSTTPFDIGRVYIIEFIATSSSHTIKFTNWGHISSNATELILDNVRLYTLAELSPDVPACSALSSAPSFAASDTDVCQKFCISFSDSSTNNPIAWEWIFPGGIPASSTDQNPANICYNSPGTYDVTLITTSANGNDTLTLSNYITIYPTPPFPVITQAGYTLTSTPATSYQWQLNSVDITGATNQSYMVLQSGLYTVIVGDTNACVNSANKYVLITGMDEVAGDASIFISPNPSNGSFVVEISNVKASVNSWVEIKIVTAPGQKVFSSVEKTGTNPFGKTIDLTALDQGIYFLEIRSGENFFRKKIVIVR